MTTYQIQARNSKGEWVVYMDDCDLPIEFLSRTAADTVALDLAATGEFGCSLRIKDWRICESNGDIRPLTNVNRATINGNLLGRRIFD